MSQTGLPKLVHLAVAASSALLAAEMATTAARDEVSAAAKAMESGPVGVSPLAEEAEAIRKVATDFNVIVRDVISGLGAAPTVPGVAAALADTRHKITEFRDILAGTTPGLGRAVRVMVPLPPDTHGRSTGAIAGAIEQIKAADEQLATTSRGVEAVRVEVTSLMSSGNGHGGDDLPPLPTTSPEGHGGDDLPPLPTTPAPGGHGGDDLPPLPTTPAPGGHGGDVLPTTSPEGHEGDDAEDGLTGKNLECATPVVVTAGVAIAARRRRRTSRWGTARTMPASVDGDRR